MDKKQASPVLEGNHIDVNEEVLSEENTQKKSEFSAQFWKLTCKDCNIEHIGLRWHGQLCCLLPLQPPNMEA
jgi:hypothetical protein